MRALVRWLFRLVLLAIVAAILLVVFRDALLRPWLEDQWRAYTGVDIRIGRVTTSLFSSAVRLESVVLNNAAPYGGGPLAFMPEVYVEYDRRAAMARVIRCRLVRLQISELHVVERPDGRLNLEDYALALDLIAGKDSRLDVVRFDRLEVVNLALGQVRWQRLGSGKPSVERSAGAANEVTGNLQKPGDLIRFIYRVAQRSRPGVD